MGLRRAVEEWILEMEVACTNGEVENVRYLLACSDSKYSRVRELTLVNVRDRVTMQGFLHHAARSGDSRTVTLLLDAGACIEIRDGSHRTPLHVSCEMGDSHLAVGQLLLARAADGSWL